MSAGRGPGPECSWWTGHTHTQAPWQHTARPPLHETVPSAVLTRGWPRKPRSKTHARLAEVIHPSEPVSGVSVGRRGRGRWVTWGCSTPQPQSWCPRPHAPQTFRGTREPRALPRGSPGEGEAATSRIPGGRTPASLLALSKASCAGHFMRRGPGEPGAELGVCPQGSCGGLRDTGHGAPRLGARYMEPGSGHSRTGLRRWEQVRGRSTALAPSGLEHGHSTQCGCTPSWLGAAGPEARVGVEVPTGWPLCRGTRLASPGTPQRRPGGRGARGQPGAGRQQPR